MSTRSNLTNVSDVVNNKRLENSYKLPYDLSGFGYAKAFKSKTKSPGVHPNISKGNITINEDGSRNGTVTNSLMGSAEQEQIQFYKKDLGDTSHPFSLNREPEQDTLIGANNEVTDKLGNGYTHPFSQNTEVGGFGGNSTGNTSTSSNTQLPNGNVLLDYEPMNYIITLSCLSKQAFNTGVNGTETVILQSGGKGKQGDGPLGVDYYIDNLVIRNSVAPNEVTASGSMYQILFDVTEPYGTSFIDALIQAAKIQGYKDHTTAVYNLRIEFKGYDENQQPKSNIPFSTRDVPMNIYDVKMNIDAGVTTYQCQCRPGTALPLTDLYQTLQASVTCSGDTVGDLIEDFLNKYSQELSSLQTNSNLKFKPGKTDQYVLDRSGSMKDILSSPINYSESSSLIKMFAVSNLGVNQAPPGYARIVTVNKGTKIQTFIEAVVKESRFYRDQFVGNRPKTLELTTLRLETQLEIGEDNGNGRDQYTFVYVLRSQVYTSDLMDGTIDITNYLTPSRTYNYSFTGANRDVLNFNLNYQFSYYQVIPYLVDDGSAGDLTGSAGGEVGQDINLGDQTKKSTVGDVKNEVQNIGQQDLIDGLNDSNGQIVQSFQDLIQNPRADLVVTNIEILGDPYWIPQKNVSNRSFQNTFTGTTNTDASGAVATDEGQLVIKINVKQPVDLDDESGLFKNLQDIQGFQGFYRVYLCEHRFENGIYTTVLSCYRVKNQSSETKKEVSKSSLTNDSIIKVYDLPTLADVGASGEGEGFSPQVEIISMAGDAFGGGTKWWESGNVVKMPINEAVSNGGTGGAVGIVKKSTVGQSLNSMGPDVITPKIDVEFVANKSANLDKYLGEGQRNRLQENLGTSPQAGQLAGERGYIIGGL